MVPTTHEQNVICSKTRLDGTTHEQTIICRQLFAGHVVGSRPMKRKEKMHRMIIRFIEDLAGTLVHHLEIDRRLLSNKRHTKRQTKWKGIKPQEGKKEK